MDIPTLTTPRLRLREPDEGDAVAIHNVHRHKSVADGVISIPHPHTLNDAHAWLTRLRAPAAEGRRNYIWLICLADTGEVIGDCGLHIDLKHRRGVLGYLIRPDHWGKGIATEAIGAVAGFAFSRHDPPLIRIEADHTPRTRLRPRAGETGVRARGRAPVIHRQGRRAAGRGAVGVGERRRANHVKPGSRTLHASSV